MKAKSHSRRKKSALRRGPEARVQKVSQQEVAPLDPTFLTSDNLNPQQILHLQNTIGNRAVQRLIGERAGRQTRNQPWGADYSTDGSVALAVGAPVAQRALETALLVQRAMAKYQVMWETTHLRKGTHLRESQSEPGKQYYRVEDDEVATLSGGEIINVDPMQRGRKKDEPKGQHTWVKGENGGNEGFVKEDRVAPIGEGMKGMKAILGGFAPTTQQETEATEESKPNVFDPAAITTMTNLVGSSTGTMGEGIESQFLKEVKDGKLVDKESMKGSDLDKAKTSLDVVSGFSDVFGGLFGMVNSIGTLSSTKSDWMDKTVAVLSGLESASKLVSGASKGIYGVHKLAGSHPESESMKAEEAVGKVTGIITDGLGAIKSTFDMVFKIVKQIKDAGKKSAGSHFKSAVDTVKSALEAATSAVKMVKGIMDMAGGATVAVANTVPALGIAVGAANLAIQGFSFAKSWIQINGVRKVESLFKTVLERTQSPDESKRYVSEVKGKKMVDREKMAERKAHLEQRLTKTDLKDETRERYQKELDAIKEYELAHEMKYIGKKRRTRAGLHIFTAMSAIAGDIATLSGVGATVGAPLKIFSSVFEAGMVGVRKLKQFGRDKGWWGSGQKTTDAKQKKRLEHAKLLMQMVANLPKPPAEDDPKFVAVTAQYKQVETLLGSTGVDLTELYSHNEEDDGPEQQFKLLVKSMAERE